MRPSPIWNVPANSWKRLGSRFEAALVATRAGNVFTTHTAVAAGFDLFDPALVEQYLGGYADQKLGINAPRFAGVGRSESE